MVSPRLMIWLMGYTLLLALAATVFALMSY
jgi:hypothetical protein